MLQVLRDVCCSAIPSLNMGGDDFISFEKDKPTSTGHLGNHALCMTTSM